MASGHSHEHEQCNDPNHWHEHAGVLTRRSALLMGAAAGLAGSLGFADAADGPAPSERKVIDVHHHCFPPLMRTKRRQELMETSSTPEVLDWTPQWSIDDMDKGGVATSILSCVGPGVWNGNIAESRAFARDYNDYTAGLVKQYPGRFGFFAAIPLPDVEGSLKEIEYGLDTLKADGICLHASFDDKYLGDSSFLPVLEELNRRKAVIYVHPNSPSCCAKLVPDLPQAFIEFPFANTRAIASLLYAGTLSRLTDIQWIFSHGGGTVPFLANRMSNWANQPEMKKRMPKGPAEALARLNFDTASVTNANAWAAISSFTTMDKIMFGTDFPWGKSAPYLDQLRKLTKTPADLAAVEYGNARRLIRSQQHLKT